MDDRKQEILRSIDDKHQQSWSILTSISEADMDVSVYRSEDHEWTVKDLLAHLADAETGLLGQARRIAKDEQTVPEDFDINRWNRSAVRKRASQSFAEHLSIIGSAFEELLEFLEEVEPEKLGWRGRHSSGAMLSLEEYFHRIVDHRLEHATDIRKALDGQPS